MNNPFDNLFGSDYCQYEFTKTKHCVLAPGQLPVILYDHKVWEKNLASVGGEEVKEDETVVKPVFVGAEAVKEDEAFVNPASVVQKHSQKMKHLSILVRWWQRNQKK